jgi:DNA-directed RNA polymerase specialized sigma24 family protein
VDHTSDEDHQFQFTSDDLAKLRSVVRARASAELGTADVEDITGEILLSACVTAANADATAPIAALAFTYAALPSYYADARKTAAAVVDRDPTLYELGSQDASIANLSVEIRHALYSLSQISGTIIWMCDVEGMTLSESATALGVSTATAYRRLQHAHEDFRAVWTA